MDKIIIILAAMLLYSTPIFSDVQPDGLLNNNETTVKPRINPTGNVTNGNTPGNVKCPTCQTH